MTDASDLREDAGRVDGTIRLEAIVVDVPAATTLARIGFRIGSFAVGGSGTAGSVSGVASLGVDELAAVLLGLGAASPAAGIAPVRD